MDLYDEETFTYTIPSTTDFSCDVASDSDEESDSDEDSEADEESDSDEDSELD